MIRAIVAVILAGALVAPASAQIVASPTPLANSDGKGSIRLESMAAKVTPPQPKGTLVEPCPGTTVYRVVKGTAPCPTAPVATAPKPAPTFWGVNVSGMEFTGHQFVPTAADLDFYIDAGARSIRLPVKRDRLLKDPAVVAKVKALALHTTSRGVLLVLDEHSYSDIGNPEVEAFWLVVGPQFRGLNVAFDLQNEPNGGDWQTWGVKAKRLIANLRAAGIDNQLLLEWRQSSGASRMDKGERHKLADGSRDCASAICSLEKAGVYKAADLDPLGKTWLSPHRYFDATGSGTSTYCEANTPGGYLGVSTAAARRAGFKLFLGEFAFGRAAGITGTCARIGPQVLAYLKANSDVWVGGAAWGGGKAWSSSYTFRIENSKDRAASWSSENGKLLIESWTR